MYSSALIASLLKYLNKTLYTYPGGTIAPIFHECKAIGVPLICTKNEQGAGYMAIADALVTQTASFVAVTSGPGATNLITCIADAFYDSIPLIAFTGQVGTKDLARSETLRQRGFQEVPIMDMVKKITKATLQPQTPQELAEMLIQALHCAMDGRPGPVLIDLPMDVQLTPLPDGLLESMLQALQRVLPSSLCPPVEPAVVEEIRLSLASVSRPLILAGGGAMSSSGQLKDLAHRLGIPVVTSMRGVGVFPTNDPLSAGWIGHTGMPWSNWALSQADWVLVLGSRLDVRQTGTMPDRLADKTVFHVDIDTNELTHVRVPNARSIHCSVAELLAALNQDSNLVPPDFSDWRGAIDHQKQGLTLQDRGGEPGVAPDELLACIDRYTLGKQTAVVTGVGSHQQWAARHFTFIAPEKLLFTSAGHGTMGYSLPVALGVKRLNPDRIVISVDGDGSFQMNIQELAMISELKIPLKILIMDNNRLGIVSQFQQITFADDPVTGSFQNPDFIRIAEAYGLKAWDLPEMDVAVIAAWLDEPGPALLRVHIQHDAPVSPMLLGGQALDAMWHAEVKQP